MPGEFGSEPITCRCGHFDYLHNWIEVGEEFLFGESCHFHSCECEEFDENERVDGEAEGTGS